MEFSQYFNKKYQSSSFDNFFFPSLFGTQILLNHLPFQGRVQRPIRWLMMGTCRWWCF